MNRWAERHRTALEADLLPGEHLQGAGRAIATRRRRLPRDIPRHGFVIGVTDQRVLIWRASTWLARPLNVVTSWSFNDGVTVAAAPLGRLRLLLPDRSIVTLRPYGGRSLHDLVV